MLMALPYSVRDSVTPVQKAIAVWLGSGWRTTAGWGSSASVPRNTVRGSMPTPPQTMAHPRQKAGTLSASDSEGAGNTEEDGQPCSGPAMKVEAAVEAGATLGEERDSSSATRFFSLTRSAASQNRPSPDPIVPA